MRITLCGSAKFEDEFKRMDKLLSLQGHVVYTLSVYPSYEGNKEWYTREQKIILDNVHRLKIDNSDAIFVIAPNNYIGKSTEEEIIYAIDNNKPVFYSMQQLNLYMKANNEK